MIIYQGNTYDLPIKLKFGANPITAANVKKVEFAFGDIIKMYPEQVTFDGEAFKVPLTQENTFSLDPKEKPQYQVRVYFTDDSVKCTGQRPLNIQPSISKVVLK